MKQMFIGTADWRRSVSSPFVVAACVLDVPQLVNIVLWLACADR